MRWLALGEMIVAALIGVLLLSSPATLAYYRFGWLANLLIAGLIWVLARRRAYRALIGLSALGLPAALIALPPHYGALDLLLILWTLGALPLISAGLIGRESSANWLRPELLIVVIAAGCAVSLWSLRAFPNFSATDEAIIYDYVDTFERTGKIEASLVPYDAPTVTGNLYVYAAALWTDALPGDPFALRALSLLGGFVLIAVVFLAARALHDRLTGLIAAALLATNLLWTAVAHVGRQEIWLAVFVWAAVWLSIEAIQRRSARIALLAGLSAALSADVHPLGALACVALGVWWISETFIGANRRLLLAFVGGGLIGTAYYLGAHVLPDPGYFVAGIRDELVSYGAEGWSPLAAMVARHANYLAANPLEVGLLVIGTLAAWRRRISGIVVALVLLYTLTVADPNLYYPIVWITGMVILTALTLRTTRWRAPLMVAFLAAFVLNATLIARQVNDDWNGRALDAIQQVAARVPQNQRGLSESFLYLALRDPKLIGFTFVNYWAAGAGISQWDVVQTLQPDWIVTMGDEAAFTPEFGVLSVDVPHMHLPIPPLATQYRLAESVATSVGTFEIWTRRD